MPTTQLRSSFEGPVIVYEPPDNIYDASPQIPVDPSAKLEPCHCAACQRGANRFGQKIPNDGHWPPQLIGLLHYKKDGKRYHTPLSYECWLERNAPPEQKHIATTESPSGHAMMVMESMKELGVIVRVEHQCPLPADDPDCRRQWRICRKLLLRYWELRILDREDSQEAWDARLELEERFPMLSPEAQVQYRELYAALANWEENYMDEE